jgi:hypothetical protein
MRIPCHRLFVANALHDFIENEVLPGTGIDSSRFWSGFDAIVCDLAPKNAALLAERDRLQSELDAWHSAHPGPIADPAGYRDFLERTGYLLPTPGAVQVTTAHVDCELAEQAGPQLVVPVLNARYVLNAANARWGSLYDALYGTDAIAETDGATRQGPGQAGDLGGAARVERQHQGLRVFARQGQVHQQPVVSEQPHPHAAEHRTHVQVDHGVLDAAMRAVLVSRDSGHRLPRPQLLAGQVRQPIVFRRLRDRSLHQQGFQPPQQLATQPAMDANPA